MIWPALIGALLILGPGAEVPAVPALEGQTCLGIAEDGAVQLLEPPVAGEPEGSPWSAFARLWCWSDGTPPELYLPGVPSEQAELESLAVELQSGREESCQGMELIAAPTAMWREVPEPLLPRIDVPKDCRLSLQRAAGQPWRTRAISGPAREAKAPHWGSDWLEIERQARRVTLPLQTAQDHTLEVSDQQGSLLTGARLDLLRRRAAGDQAELAAFLAERGTIRIPSLTGAGVVTAVVVAPDHVARSFVTEPRALPRVVVLEVGATLRGRFVDSKAQPLAGVELHAESWLDPRSQLLLRRQAESGEDGSWLLDGLPVGEIVLEARSQEHASWRHSVELDEVGADLGEIVLHDSRTLRLRLLSSEGTPIPGAWVAREGQRLATADADGRLEIEGLAPDKRLRLLADAEGFQALETWIGGEQEEPVELRLRPAFEVSGLFLSSQREPLQRARAEMRAGSNSWTENLRPDGFFRLELPPEKPIELTLRSPQSALRVLHLEPGEPGEHRDLGELLASPGVVVIGKVVAEEDLQPIPGARVWLPRPSASDALVRWFHRDFLESVTDENGRFRLEGLDRSAAELRVDVSGFAQGRFRLRSNAVKDEGEPVDLGALHLVRGRTVEIELEGEEALHAVARLDPVGRWREMDMIEAPVAEGFATFYNIAPGALLLSVLAEGELVCEEQLEIPDGEGPFEASCRREGLDLTGVVRIGGQAAGPGKLIWLPPAGDEVSMVIRNASPLGQQGGYTLGAGRPSIEIEVSDSGFFSSRKLRAGTWKTQWRGAAGGSSAPQRVVLPQQARAEITLDFPGHRIDGRVVDSEGQAVEGARVHELVSGGFELSGADGSFQFVAFQAGETFVRAEHLGKESPPVRILLAPDQPIETVELVLGADDEAERLRVLAVDRHGAPIAGAIIFVDLESRGMRTLSTDWQGRAKLRLDPPLPSSLRMAGWTAGTWFLGTPIPVAEAMAEPQLLRFSEGGTLLLRSSNQQRQIHLRSGNGWDLGILSARLGHPPLWISDSEHPVEGLPEGTYHFEDSDGTPLTARNLRPGEQLVVEFD